MRMPSDIHFRMKQRRFVQLCLLTGLVHLQWLILVAWLPDNKAENNRKTRKILATENPHSEHHLKENLIKLSAIAFALNIRQCKGERHVWDFGNSEHSTGIIVPYFYGMTGLTSRSIWAATRLVYNCQATLAADAPLKRRSSAGVAKLGACASTTGEHYNYFT